MLLAKWIPLVISPPSTRRCVLPSSLLHIHLVLRGYGVRQLGPSPAVQAPSQIPASVHFDSAVGRRGEREELKLRGAVAPRRPPSPQHRSRPNEDASGTLSHCFPSTPLRPPFFSIETHPVDTVSYFPASLELLRQLPSAAETTAIPAGVSFPGKRDTQSTRLPRYCSPPKVEKGGGVSQRLMSVFRDSDRAHRTVDAGHLPNLVS